MKKAMSLLLLLTLLASLLTACGGGGGGGSSADGGALDTNLPTYDALKVGEDYTDITAELRVITQRTDLVDTTFAEYVKEFNKLYPNITINYEGITNYSDDMTARLSSSNWGDICMMPTNILLPDLYLYFQPLCELSALQDYNFASNRAYDGLVYGIPSTGNAQGVIYNKKVAEAAGYSSSDPSLKAHAQDAGRVPDLPPGHQRQNRRDPSVHQLRRRLAHGGVGRLHRRLRYRQRGLDEH